MEATMRRALVSVGLDQMRYALAIACALFTADPGAANGQEQVAVRVKVEAAPGVPIPSALVSLVDATNRVVGEKLSSANGQIVMAAPRGTYSVRVRRIGYKPFTSEKVSLPSSDEIIVRVESEKVVLTTMRVGASARCGKINPDAEALSEIWEEVEKGLRSSQLNVRDLSTLSDIHVYERQVNGTATSYTLDTTIVRSSGLKPFGTPDPAALARLGYVRGGPATGWKFFGPDEQVLLSEEFAATHCFRIVRDAKREDQIGIAFKVVEGRRAGDIEGVMWLNEKTAELSDVIFSYVNLGVLTRWEAGGFTRFKRVPSGALVVDEWQLRMPSVAFRRQKFELVSYIERGGVFLNLFEQSRSVLAGQVYDSVSGNYLAGAVISFRDAVATSDSSGRFAFTNLSLGDGKVRYTHPVLDERGIEALELPVKVYGDTTRILLTFPSRGGMWQQFCKTSADPSLLATKGIVHGYVTDAAGKIVPFAQVTFRWIDKGVDAPDGIPSFRAFTSDSSGMYAACGVPASAQGTIAASIGASSTASREFSFETSTVIRRDLSFDGLQLSGNSRGTDLIVSVTDATGAPLPDVMLFAENTTGSTRTNDQGRALLSLSTKEATINAKRMGYVSQSVGIRLGEGQRQLLRIKMSTAQLLPTVSVVDRALFPSAMERRRQIGRGTFFGPEEVAAVHELKTLIGRVPGASIQGTGLWAVRFRHPSMGGDCYPDFYLDGRATDPGGSAFGRFADAAKKSAFLETLGPSSIYAVEVYERASQAPMEFIGVRDGCGVIMVWTKDYVERTLAAEAKPKSVRDTAAR